MENNVIRKLWRIAWFPTKVKIVDDDSSKTVIIWFSSYILKQKFEKISDKKNGCTWGWTTVSKYLQEK